MPKSKSAIPARWECYRPLGRAIPGTRLLAFKVPLTKAACNNLPPRNRFTPQDLMRNLRESGLNLGLVVDLTNTSRYYNPQEFTQAGVEYYKLFTEGHVIPNKQVVDSFTGIIQEFLSRHSSDDLIIGVHCTHGINRTGYLICRYMIECLGITATDALAAFGEARSHKVERHNYIDDLHKLSKAKLAPNRPASYVRVPRVYEVSSQPSNAGQSLHHAACDNESHNYVPGGSRGGKGQYCNPPYKPRDSQTWQGYRRHDHGSSGTVPGDTHTARNGYQPVAAVQVKQANSVWANTSYQTQWASHSNPTSGVGPGDMRTAGNGYQPVAAVLVNQANSVWANTSPQTQWASHSNPTSGAGPGDMRTAGNGYHPVGVPTNQASSVLGTNSCQRDLSHQTQWSRNGRGRIGKWPKSTAKVSQDRGRNHFQQSRQAWDQGRSNDGPASARARGGFPVQRDRRHDQSAWSSFHGYQSYRQYDAHGSQATVYRKRNHDRSLVYCNQ